MGVRCGKEVHYRVTYSAQSLELRELFEDLSELRHFICSKFPALFYTAFELRVKGQDSRLIKSSQEYQQAVRRAQDNLVLEVHLESPAKFSSQLFDNLSRGLVKLRHMQGPVEATGILIGSVYVITTAEQLRDRDALAEYTVITHDNCELKLKKDGEFLLVGHPPALALAELQVSRDWIDDAAVIKLHNEAALAQGNIATVLYFTKQRPTLHEAKQPVQLTEARTFQLAGQPLKEGSSGAPVFNSAGVLVGFYSPYLDGGSVMGVSHLIEELLQRGSMKAVGDIVSHSNMFMTEFTENQADGSESESAHYKPLTPCYFNPHTQHLVQVKRNSLVSSSVTLPNGVGLVAVYTPHGIFITGKAEQYTKAWILHRSGTLQELPDMEFPHKHHCIAVAKHKAYVVSGKYSGAIESWSFRHSSWTQEGDFPKPLEAAAAAYFNATLFVVGGRVGAKKEASRRIYALSKNVWEELSLKLPERVFSHTLIPTKSKLLVVGGYSTQNGEVQSRESVLALDLSQETGELFETLPSLAFQGLPAVKWQGSWWAYTVSGVCVKYALASKTFEVMS